MGDDEIGRSNAARTGALVARIDAAVAAGDWTTALDLFLQSSVALLGDRSRWSRDLLAAVPDELPMDPVLRQMRTFVVGPSGGTVPTAPGDGQIPPEARSVAALFQVITLRTLGRLDEAEQVARSVAAMPESAGAGEINDRAALLRLQIGILRLLRGDLDEAAEDLRMANLVAQHARSDFVVRNSAGDLALIHALRGDLSTADRWLEVFDSTPADPEGDFERRVRVGGIAAAAFVALARLRLDEARAQLRRLADIESGEELWVFVAVARALLALSEGDAVAGLAVLEAARGGHRNLRAQGGIAAPLLIATSTDLLLAVGQGARARTVLAATDVASDMISLRRARVAGRCWSEAGP